MKANGIHHKMGAPFHPSSNGLAERMVQSVKKSLAKMQSEPGTMAAKLSRFLFADRNTPHATTGKTSAEMLMGRRPRTRMDLIRPASKQPQQQVESTAREFRVGQAVLARDYRLGKSKWQHGTIERRLGTLLYLVRAGDALLKRHVDQLLPSRKVDRERAGDEDLPDADTHPQPEEEVPAVQADVEVIAAPIAPIVPDDPILPDPPAEQIAPNRTSQRNRRPPSYLNDFVRYIRGVFE